MADFRKACDYVLRHEDSTLSGVIVPDPTEKDPTAVARFGVNSAAHPELVALKFFDKKDGTPSMDATSALAIAEDCFKYDYFMYLGGYAIDDQDVANKFSDLAFEAGVKEASEIVQRAVNSVTGNPAPIGLTIDGIPGARTIAAMNACEPERLLPAIKEQGKIFFEGLVASGRRPAKDLDPWIKRLEL